MTISDRPGRPRRDDPGGVHGCDGGVRRLATGCRSGRSRLLCEGTRDATAFPRPRVPGRPPRPASAMSACSTSTGSVAMRPPAALACTMLFPGVTPTTSPVLSTVATSGLSDFQSPVPTAQRRPVLVQRLGRDQDGLAREQHGRGRIEREQRSGRPPARPLRTGDQHGERRPPALGAGLDLGQSGGDAQHVAVARDLARWPCRSSRR